MIWNAGSVHFCLLSERDGEICRCAQPDWPSNQFIWIHNSESCINYNVLFLKMGFCFILFSLIINAHRIEQIRSLCFFLNDSLTSNVYLVTVRAFNRDNISKLQGFFGKQSLQGVDWNWTEIPNRRKREMISEFWWSLRTEKLFKQFQRCSSMCQSCPYAGMQDWKIRRLNAIRKLSWVK